MTLYSPGLEQGGQEVEHGLCSSHGGLGFPLWILPSSVSTTQCLSLKQVIVLNIFTGKQ